MEYSEWEFQYQSCVIERAITHEICYFGIKIAREQ